MNKYNFILEKVKEAAEIIADMQAEGFSVEFKAGNPKDLVTNVDKVVEDFLKKEILSFSPEDSIYGEEGARVEGTSEYSWAIDPIDGTANFSRSIPHYAICIALLKNDDPIMGAVYNPVTRELFSFEKGRGAFLNDKKITVSKISELKDSQIFFTAGRQENTRDWAGDSYKNLLGAAKKTRNFASSSLDVCFVAAGRIEGVVYGTINTLDIAAAFGILKEAGGNFYNQDGPLNTYSTERQKIYIANNEKIYKELKGIL